MGIDKEIYKSLFLNKNNNIEYEILKHKSHLLDLIVENTDDLITISSIKGEYLYVSPICTNILGYNSEEMIGTYRKDYIPRDDYKKVIKELSKSKDSITTYIYRFRKKDGRLIWLESTIASLKDEYTCNVAEYISISRDITDKLKIEERLRNSEKRHRLLVEESPSSIIVYQDGVWVYVNKTGMRLLGAKIKNEIVGKSPYKFIQVEYHDIFRMQKRKVLNGEIVNFIEEKWLRLDGGILDVEIKAIPFLFDDKPAVYIVINDISKKKKMHEIVNNAEKIFVIGQLAAGIAHEIRNPLTSIKGFLQLLESEINNKEYYDVLLKEIHNIEMIISELLVLSNNNISDSTKTDLIRILNQVIMLLNTKAIMFNIEIIADYPKELILFKGNENQIKQAFVNIINNAIESMSLGGQIYIKVKKKNNSAIIEIIDEGEGISKERLERLGEPFYTTKERGTGLGMMVTYNIIKNHNGKIDVTSKIGVGTTFKIELPIAKSEKEEPLSNE